MALSVQGMLVALPPVRDLYKRPWDADAVSKARASGVLPYDVQVKVRDAVKLYAAIVAFHNVAAKGH